jgi:ribosomal protein S12 methylthiotransferase accessory factor
MQAIAPPLPKADGLQRILPAEETFYRVRDEARRLGVTRLADITGLDRIGLPIYSTIAPDTNDVISVYNGKGIRRIDAMVGALMESIERLAALKTRLPLIVGSFRELARHHDVLDPLTLTEAMSVDYSEDRIYSWVEGRDIITGTSVLVPARLAGYLWSDLEHPSPFVYSNTNGLAAGNCRQEAICHALCEVVERDAWTMAELGSHKMPEVRRSIVHGPDKTNGPDDLEMLPCLDVDQENPIELYHNVGLHPVVRDITSEVGIPTIIASVADEAVPGFPMAHSGLGCHPDARVALRRALTELAQSRCVDIQGVREDLVSADAPFDGALSMHTRRVPYVRRQSWYLAASVARRKLPDLPSVVNDDIQSDLDHILARLAACNMKQVIVVDLSPPDAPYSVVRVIVPGIEYWASDHGRIGMRATEFWRKYA